ncbi:MAG: polyphosphate kinase 2 family protein [Actinobacteria bacterium]|nr:polyphosphate kinase 2 family protein [Actinomycetota bacterium]
MTKRAATARSVREALRVAEGPFTLLGYDPESTPLAPGSKAKARKDLERTGPLLAGLQEMLYADGASGDRRRVLLVLQGTDTSGKDGVVSHVVGQVGPAGVRITSFRRPTPEERAHHFLWRIRRALPAAGVIGVFNRSHYEDVLVTRVHESIDEATWAERIAEINAFERELAESGTVIVKCFLHISYGEQRERLLARLDDPAKLWKFNPADLDERAYWADYQSAYAAAIAATSTEWAPWYIVPGDAKWYRNWAISQLLYDALAGMKLSYPPADFDIEAARARLRPPF